MRWKNLQKIITSPAYIPARLYSDVPPSHIRNIGIIAHIDAGKTTTTERMLYYSGAIKLKGNVDSGNTVTDFLPSERARGITVQSAAVTFDWKGTSINVIDTPGHVDFTVEVERSLHVLDGAVAVLDASRGVEAQTRTVWRQADKMKIPRIAFINKMDKSAANFFASVMSMHELLSANTLITQIPFMENSRFCGIIDLIYLTLTKWPYCQESKKYSHHFNMENLISLEDKDLWDEALVHRQRLIEKLADVDDDIADTYLTRYSQDVSKFPNSMLIPSLSDAVKHKNVVPVFCGSAVHDIGIHSLLDSVVNYLPSPKDVNASSIADFAENMVSYAFKVVTHKRYGSVIFARVYTGTIKTGSTLFNSSKQIEEKVGQLFTVFADEFLPVDSASEGQIVAITGFQRTSTGDTLLNGNSKSSKVLSPVKIPQPVFFCTIEADSPSELKNLAKCLGIVTREDPSLKIKKDQSTGQLILCGMGELHLEVIIERLRKEFKVSCYTGPLQVAYKEHPTVSVKRNLSYNREILHQNHDFQMTLAIEPTSSEAKVSINLNKIRKSVEIRKAINNGIMQASESGNVMGFPLVGADITAIKFEMTTNSPLSVISAAAVHMTRHLFDEAQCCVLEPIMDISIVTTSEKMSLVLASLSKRRAEITEVSSQNANRFITAKAPVAEMLGYSSKLRSIASGHADLTMSVHGYKVVDEFNLEKIKDKLSGHI